ncbi:MAG: hypothetical protein M3Q28_02790 [Pseudomonadota bacterium]|nr:hypothetical protein [Pseudomonadota bacterium]
MKIAVLRTGPLFAHDDAALYVAQLCSVLSEAGHSIETTLLPFSSAIADVVKQSVAYRLFDLTHGSDLCIAIGPFAHAFNHPNKRIWLLSQYGPIYDLWDTRFGASSTRPSDVSTRDYVYAVDRAWLSEARLVCSGSHTIAQTVLNDLGTETQLLPPALPNQYRYATNEHEGFFVAAGPLLDTARISLLIDSFSHTVRPARLVIMGFVSSPSERDAAQQMVLESTKAEFITLEINPTYDRVFKHVSSALALVSVPYRCSTLDIFTVAASWSRKTVLTTIDSGELARLVEHQADGYCVEANAVALAQAMDEISGDLQSAKRLGDRFGEKLNGMTPTWAKIAQELTK